MSDFLSLDKPHICIITNHGYGGVKIPFGGAPDTGGQNVYVNSYAKALGNLGFKVTIYARGGFLFYQSNRLREGEEYLTPNIRYVYVPGGGSEFLRKEEIGIALIEQIDWIYDHIRLEAKKTGIFPSQYYDMISTHYWDAGVIGVSLVVKWQNDLTFKMIECLTEGVIAEEEMQKFKEMRHYRSISKAPAYSLGKLLLDCVGEDPYIYQEEIMYQVFELWTEKSALAVKLGENLRSKVDWQHFRSSVAAATKELRPLVLSEVLGTTILEMEIHNDLYAHEIFKKYRTYEDTETFYDVLKQSLKQVNKHVWTPHSLGVIKEWNFRNKPLETIRELRFRERRSHERMICDYTPALGATSYEIAETLVANYGAKIDDVVFYPPGVDISIFHEYPKESIDKLHTYLGSKTSLTAKDISEKTIIFETSRMDVTKRKDLIIEAFRIVAERNCDDCLLIIGGGPNNKIYEDLKKQLESYPILKNRAFVIGFIDDEYVPLLFDRCDIYITPSEMEGFGISVAQAAADGKAIISSDMIPFTSYYISDDAIIVESGNAEGFADAIIHLVNDKEDRLARGARIKEKTLSLQWENLTRNFIFHLNQKGFNIPITEKMLVES